MAKTDSATEGDPEVVDIVQPESDTKKPKKAPTVIKYIGTADVKRLTAENLRAMNVEAETDLRWDRQNSHTVDVADVNPATLEYLRSQPDFSIS